MVDTLLMPYHDTHFVVCTHMLQSNNIYLMGALKVMTLSFGLPLDLACFALSCVYWDSCFGHKPDPNTTEKLEPEKKRLRTGAGDAVYCVSPLPGESQILLLDIDPW